MNPESDIRLLYELNAKSDQLELAIQQVERQLAAVNKKLHSLWHDLAIYVAMAILPELFYQICAVINFISIILPFWIAFRLIIRCIYIILLPFVVIQLGRTIYLLMLNRESKTAFSEPVRLGKLHNYNVNNNNLQREPSYRAEQKKLVYILSRYYFNRDIIEQLRRQIMEPDSGTLTFAQLRTELNKLVFYEDVRPAETYKTGNYVIPMIIAYIVLTIYVMCIWGVI